MPALKNIVCLTVAIRTWLALVLLSTSACSSAAEPVGPVVLVFILDGLERDAADVAAANGAVNLKFLMQNGVTVRDAYSTSPAPRMFLPDGSLPWGTSTSPNVAMHTGTYVFESRQMDDIFLSSRRGGIKSVFVGGANNYDEFTTPDFSYAGTLTDSDVVEHGINHFKNDGTRLIRLHLQRIRDNWSGPIDKLDPNSQYQKDILKADELLGKFIRVLKEANVWETTYIIVSSDHGMGQSKNSDHPPSVFSSWLPFMNFYGPKIKKGKMIPYAETPDIALMVNHFLNLKPLQGHTDPKITMEPKGTTATFLSNIFEGNPDEFPHPQLIKKYLEIKSRTPGDDFADYRSSMMTLIIQEP